MQYNWEFGPNIKCSDQDRRRCLGLVSQIVSMAVQSRQFGLLALADILDESQPFLLRKGFQLIADGVKPHVVESIMNLYVLCGNYTGKDLLERCIILEGVLAIQNGLNPKIIKELLLSFFGEEGYQLYRAEFEEEENAKLKAFYKGLASAEETPARASKLDRLLPNLEDDSIRKILKEIDTVDLATAVKGMEERSQLKIIRNMPKRSIGLLQDVMDQLGTTRQSEIDAAQDKICEILSDLNIDDQPSAVKRSFEE